MQLKLTIPLTIILLFLLQPILAHANSAPVYMPANPNGTIIPFEDIPVLVKEEKLQFVLQEDYAPARAAVQYVFLNTSPAPIEPFLAFPFVTYHQEEFPRIFVNNQEIPASDIKLLDDSKELERFLKVIHSAALSDIDPITGKPLEHFGEYGQHMMTAAIFKVPFPSNQEVTLRLEYDQAAGIDRDPYIHPIYLYQYLLQPASEWKEFHNLQISFAVPREHYFSANLPVDKYKGDFSDWLPLPQEVADNKEKWQFFQGNFEKLPESNLSFSKLSQKDLLFGMVEKGSYDLLGLLFLWIMSTTTIILMAILILRFKKWWMNWLVGPILSFIMAGLAAIAAYVIFNSLVPIASNGDLIGGYGLIITFLLFIVYNAVIYFPIMIILVWLNRILLNKKIRNMNNGDGSSP